MLFKTIFNVSVLSLSVLFAAHSTAQGRLSESEIGVAMRAIGHEVLKAHNDTTSRVLPIASDGQTHFVQFDTEFIFKASTLALSVDKVVKQYRLASDYIVEMEHCDTGEIIHSYQINGILDANMIACGDREQPLANYKLRLTVLEEMQAAEPITAIGPTSIPIKALGVISALFMIGFFIIAYRKKSEPTVDLHLIPIGSYRFDPHKMLLLNGEQSTSLTSKESELLTLLHQSVNATISRDDLLHKVWGDKGDYIGRTLDVFISKLRKKLEGDPNVKITNIRGVGYRLVV